MKLYEHLQVLGKRVQDKVTGFSGVACSVSFDLYGCIQIIINPGLGKDGKLGDQLWFDLSRIKVLSEKPAMDPPDYIVGLIAEGKKGPADKPTFYTP